MDNWVLFPRQPAAVWKYHQAKVPLHAHYYWFADTCALLYWFADTAETQARVPLTR